VPDVEKTELQTQQTAAVAALKKWKAKVLDLKNKRLKRLGLPVLRNQDRTNRHQAARDESGRERSGRADDRPVRDHAIASARGNHSGTQPWHTPDLLSFEDIARLADTSLGVAPGPVPERVAGITARAHWLYHNDLVKVCGVCDQQRFATDPLPWNGERHLTIPVNLLPGSAHNVLCKTDAMELHDDLRAQYDVSKHVPADMIKYVEHLLLSPRGMCADGRITVCQSCHQSLLDERMPKFSIANGSAYFPCPLRRTAVIQHLRLLVRTLLAACQAIHAVHCNVY
jgi:hypothetical protein